MNAVRLAAGLCLLAAAQAHASSPDAWADLQRRSDRACLAKARDLRQARIVAYSPDFQGHTVSTVVGSYRQGAMRGREARLTCLFSKSGGVAQVSELTSRR